MARLVYLLAWFVALEVVWAVLVGTTQSTELIVGLGVAAIGAAFAELLRSLGLFGFRVDPSLLAKAWRLPFIVVFDFGVVTWALVRALSRGSRVRGEWVRVPFAMKGGPTGRWQRAFGVATANGAPNALVVDYGDDDALLHALNPGVFTGRTVL